MEVLFIGDLSMWGKKVGRRIFNNLKRGHFRYTGEGGEELKTSEHVYETCARFTKVGIVVSSGFYSEENRSRSSWNKRKVTFLGKLKWGFGVDGWRVCRGVEFWVIGSESLKLFWDEMWSRWKLILELLGSLVKELFTEGNNKNGLQARCKAFMRLFITVVSGSRFERLQMKLESLTGTKEGQN
jgi:hypothetical protein